MTAALWLGLSPVCFGAPDDHVWKAGGQRIVTSDKAHQGFNEFTGRTALMVMGLALFLPIAPYAVAVREDPQRFLRYPYQEGKDYAAGARGHAFWSQGSVQFLEDGRKAEHASAGWRAAGRLGADLHWSGFSRSSLHHAGLSDYVSGHVTASVSESDEALFEYGLGAATLQKGSDLWGPSAELSWNWFWKKPWRFYARWESGFMTEGRVYHDAAIGAGGTWRCLGLRAGARGFLNPLRNEGGPELSLEAWF